MENKADKKSRKTFRNLFTRVVPDKREKIKKEIADKEAKKNEENNSAGRGRKNGKS